MDNVTAGQLLAEGKTKKIFKSDESGYVIIESKDDLTAGDGAKHDIINGKATFSNRTNSNVLRLIRACDLPVAFIKEIDATQFLAEQCAMIPYEVVVRREAHGSYLHRHPHLPQGHLFPALLLEYFAKTKDRVWMEQSIPMDDPFLDLFGDLVRFYIPHWNEEQKEAFKRTGFAGFLVNQRPFLEIPRDDFLSRTACTEENLVRMGEVAKRTFLVLEKAWQLVDRQLVDLKVEFGTNREGELRLADVIDNDSWRVLDDGKYIDKQLYRDGTDLDTVTAKYQLVTELTRNFNLPRQQIILWRASESDDLTPFEKALDSYGNINGLTRKTVTCSLHKEPIQACKKITKLVQEIPDSVIIVYCGRSNGAGPTLSTQCTVPVITVPATWREFSEDVWSSLRTPSETPVATILDPKNAVLSALQILAMRNPLLYAELRLRQEKRLCNILSF